MLRGGLCLSITPFLPQLLPALARDIPIWSQRVRWCLPWGAQGSFLPIALSGWFCRANPLLTQLRWCPPSEQAPPKAGHGARGSACLLNKLPSCLSNSPLYLYNWVNTSLSLLTVQRGFSSGIFLTEHFLRLDRHTVLSLPLSGAVFCLFTCRKHGYNTLLCQQGNLHSTQEDQQSWQKPFSECQ